MNGYFTPLIALNPLPKQLIQRRACAINQRLCGAAGLGLVEVGFGGQRNDRQRRKVADGSEASGLAYRQTELLRISVAAVLVSQFVDQMQPVAQKLVWRPLPRQLFTQWNRRVAMMIFINLTKETKPCPPSAPCA